MADRSSIAEILDPIVKRVAQVGGVAAIALGGSQARATADENSDIDLALYYDPDQAFSVDELSRAAQELDDRHLPGLLTRFGDWGPGVNGGGWLQIGGRHLDFLYRDLGAVRAAIDECRAGRPRTVYQLGHPLGFHNQIYLAEVNCSRPLFDPAGVLASLKAIVAHYPPELRRAIVEKHLFDAAFELEIAAKPARRGDTLYVAGCLFRAAGFMLLVLYALNRRYFINEKGAMSEARAFEIRPQDFHPTVERVLAHPGESPAALASSVAQLQDLLAEIRKLAAT